MKLNIIHLSERTDRYATLTEELQTQKIKDFKIWEGTVIPGNVLYSVSQSHKKIVKWAMDNDLPEVCIGEDDIKFTAPGAFDYFVSQKPADYDLYLGSTLHGFIDEHGLISDFTSMTCYMVSKRFYRLFLSVQDVNNIDRALAIYNFHNMIKDSIKYYVCDPMICCQWGGYSDNKKKFVESYDHFLEGRRLFTGIGSDLSKRE